MTSASDAEGPVLLYDGNCGFCDRTVGLVLRHDRTGTLRFAPLHGPFAQAVLARHPDLRGGDSLVVVEGVGGVGRRGTEERVLVRSQALLRIAPHLGWHGKVLGVFALLPRAWRDRAYDAFARRRYRWFGRLDACPVPPPEVRARFLD